MEDVPAANYAPPIRPPKQCKEETTRSISKLTLDVGINLDMQEYYDNLIILRKSIDAQIETLAKEPSIYTHKETEEHNGVTVCANRFCHKVISTNGLYDYCK